MNVPTNKECTVCGHKFAEKENSENIKRRVDSWERKHRKKRRERQLHDKLLHSEK